jgi:hypothetical protein
VTLGKLEKIENLKPIWPHEARSFTPWLARPENISQLSEAIGYGPEGLEVLKVEDNVGAFYADIVARDTLAAEGGLVLIENQFGATNHDHLGKIITYAAGQKEPVRTIVWIAEKLRDEHRAALDWLNGNTAGTIGFFGIEIELWRIGESPPAPRFSVVSRPNEWVRDHAADPDLSDLRKLYIRYWDALGTLIRRRKTLLKPQKGTPAQWTNFSIGRANFALVATAAGKNGAIRAELAMTGATGKLAFARLVSQQAEIDAAYGPGLEWDHMPGRQQTRISETLPDVDIWNVSDWPRQHGWLADRLDRLHRLFHDRIRALDLTEQGQADDQP